MAISMQILSDLMKLVSLENVKTDNVQITGADPVFDSPFRVSEAAAAILAAQGVVLDQIWQRRGNKRQEISVDVMAAGVATMGVFLQSQHGYPIPVPDPDYPSVGFYPTKDGRHILLHGGYPKLRDGLLDFLRCSNNRRSLGAAVSTYNAFELEDAIAENGLGAAVARTHEEWLAHPQGQAVAAAPVVEIIKIADSDPVPFKNNSDRPLADIKVFDATHVIAGPTCAKTLASFGAEVLHIFSPSRPRLPPFDIDTGHGKLNAMVDLKNPADNQKARELIKSADIFSQSYRPGKMTSLGFSPHGLAELKPGIIVVSTACYGHEGPWHYRAGFEQLAQSASGMALAQGSIDNPQLAPTFPNDYLTGFLGALGTLVALLRRSEEGGSYHVRVALARSATWLQSYGKVDSALRPPKAVPQDYIQQYMLKEIGPLGVLSFFGSPLRMSATPPRFDRPAVPLGYHYPAWAADQERLMKEAMASS